GGTRRSRGPSATAGRGSSGGGGRPTTDGPRPRSCPWPPRAAGHGSTRSSSPRSAGANWRSRGHTPLLERLAEDLHPVPLTLNALGDGHPDLGGFVLEDVGLVPLGVHPPLDRLLGRLRVPGDVLPDPAVLVAGCLRPVGQCLVVERVLQLLLFGHVLGVAPRRGHQLRVGGQRLEPGLLPLRVGQVGQLLLFLGGLPLVLLFLLLRRLLLFLRGGERGEREREGERQPDARHGRLRKGGQPSILAGRRSLDKRRAGGENDGRFARTGETSMRTPALLTVGFVLLGCASPVSAQPEPDAKELKFTGRTE